MIRIPASWDTCLIRVTAGTPVSLAQLPGALFSPSGDPPWIADLPKHTIYRGAEKYLTRYWLLGGHDPKTNSTKHPDLPFNLFLHQFHASDLPPAHDHPWPWSRSLILQGSYVETRKQAGDYYERRTFKPGDVNDIDSSTRHYVTLQTPEVWTLFLVGRKDRPWGFWTKDGWVCARDFVGADVVDGER